MTQSARSSTAAAATSAARSASSRKKRDAKRKAAVAEELRNAYRRIEAGSTLAVDIPEPDEHLPELEPFFGCESWTPAKEFRTVPLDWCCIVATREVCVVDVCPVCYSDYTDVRLPPDFVCMGTCARSRLDARIESMLRKSA